MSRKSELKAEIAGLRERVEVLEHQLESAFGPHGESHPLSLWKEIAVLRGKTEIQMEKAEEILQSQAAAISELQQALVAALGSGLN